MADHVRHQIRAAVAAALSGMATAQNVFTSRLTPAQAAVLPCALVFTNEETTSPMDKGGGLLRDLTVAIEGHASAAADIADTLDTIAKEIEAAVAAAGDLGGLVVSVHLTATDIEMTGEGERPAGLVRLEYHMLYHTSEAAPDVAL